MLVATTVLAGAPLISSFVVRSSLLAAPTTPETFTRPTSIPWRPEQRRSHAPLRTAPLAVQLPKWGRGKEEVAGSAVTAVPAVDEKEEEEGEMSIGQMLKTYGVFALLFHFTVWITSIATVFTALTLSGGDLQPPAFLADKLGDVPTGALGKVAVTLALVEAVGPARLALTVAATPSVSNFARQFEWVSSAEESVNSKWQELSSKLGL